MSSLASLPPPPCTPDTADAFLARPSPALVAALQNWSGRVLVLGAGGKMGLHLCLMLRQALPAGVRVTAVSRFRSLRDEQSFTAGGIETIACDLSVGKNVTRLPDAGIVFFLAGVKFGTAAAPDLLHQTNVLGPGVHRVRDLAADFGRLFGCEHFLVGTEAETAWLNDATISHERWGAPPTDLPTMEQWVASWLAAGYPTWGKPTGFEKRDGAY